MNTAPVCPACGLPAIPREPDAPKCRCTWRRIAQAYHAQGLEQPAVIAARWADRLGEA